MRLFDIYSWLSEAFRPRTLAIWAVASLTIALAGPFGTYAEMPIPGRLVFWACVFGAAVLVPRPGRPGVRRWLTGPHMWTRGVVGSIGFATVFTPMVRLFHAMVMSGAASRGLPLITLWLVLFLCSILETAIWAVAQEQRDAAPAPAAPQPLAEPEPVPEPVPEPPRLVQRLDPGLRGRLVALSVRDHYVEVTTDRGEASLLMRFADALDELGATEGMRVHRSHWVARSAMAGLERQAARLFLRLKNGRLVPVSRSYREEVLALGLPLSETSGTARGGAPSRTARASSRISDRRTGSAQERPPV